MFCTGPPERGGLGEVCESWWPVVVVCLGCGDLAVGWAILCVFYGAHAGRLLGCVMVIGIHSCVDGDLFFW